VLINKKLSFSHHFFTTKNPISSKNNQNITTKYKYLHFFKIKSMTNTNRQPLGESKGLTMRVSELRKSIFERTRNAFSQENNGSPYTTPPHSPSLVLSNYDFEVSV